MDDGSVSGLCVHVLGGGWRREEAKSSCSSPAVFHITKVNTFSQSAPILGTI